MSKKVRIITIHFLLILSFVGFKYFKNNIQGFKTIKKPIIEKIKFSKKYPLNSENTVSIVSNEYHNKLIKEDNFTYKSGEWIKNKQETYASLIQFNIPELKYTDKAILHLEIESYNNKRLNKKNPNKKCNFEKKFYIKKIISPWFITTSGATVSAEFQEKKPNSETDKNLQEEKEEIIFLVSNYKEIEKLQKEGQTIAEFTVHPYDSFINIEIPIKEIMKAYGFTIDQADESFCRVSFFSDHPKVSYEKSPFIGIKI